MNLNLDDIAHCKLECTLHPSHGNAMRVVPGSGSELSKIMFIGEAPGADEDAAGLPFIGKAGRLLTKMLDNIGIDRDIDIFITNMVKCRPPNNRDPEYNEILTCSSWLNEQITKIRPEVIVLIGRIAKDFFLPSTPTITKCHGAIYETAIRIDHESLDLENETIIEMLNVKFMPILHPSYIERNGGSRGKMFKDTIADLEQLIDLCYDSETGWRKYA